MKKVLLSLFFGVVAIVMCLVLSMLFVFSLPKQYDQTFLAAMADKFELLKKTDEPKLVLIGGSNLPFGVDSALLEEHLGMKVVNFGLYAALGSKSMLDLAQREIKKGDIVVVSLEYSRQMYSLYTNPEVMLQLLDTNPKLLFNLSLEDVLAMFGRLPSFVAEKKSFIESNNKPNPQNVYSRAAFNEFGDISYPRPYNIMADLFLDDPVEIDSSIIDGAFLDYFNSFCKIVSFCGAKVFFTFPPVNRLAVQSKSEVRQDFFDMLVESLNAEIISSIEQYIMHEDFFYDSNYHLNDSGVVHRTFNLLNDLKRANKDFSETKIDLPLASGAKPSEGNGDGNNEDADFFTFEVSANRIVLTGLTEQGKLQEQLVLPSNIEGKTVYKLEAGLFSGAINLKSVTIPTSVVALSDGVFSNCPTLVRVNLVLAPELDAQLPEVGQNLLQGANPELKIYVDKSKLAQITTDYFWLKYKASILSA